MAKVLVMVCESGENSPNLVTLDSDESCTRPNRSRRRHHHRRRRYRDLKLRVHVGFTSHRELERIVCSQFICTAIR